MEKSFNFGKTILRLWHYVPKDRLLTFSRNVKVSIVGRCIIYRRKFS
ncbi:hypothetical protein LEP1GSC161_2752 [Leptospira santarosai str. CBC1416]|uniref:Uncharacterized protein n=1 Tax=Leptospira santarosai str. CBC1416 TaxID=1193059 RepID=M6W9C7_9LEPT|nr:hypothetical protein LEP1GSC161_2752 [Leptospira santarosai str. CBC1416]